MKYIYKNVTKENQSVLLSDKEQNNITTMFLQPGAMLELDYPGLNLYVPNTLHCTIINTPRTTLEQKFETPAPIIEVKVEELLEETVTEVLEIEIVETPVEKIEPKTVTPVKAKPTKKVKK